MIRNCYIQNFSAGIILYDSNHVILENNTLSLNIRGLYLRYDSNNNTISHNNIYNNSETNLFDERTANVTAEHNFWGTTDCFKINQSISDYYDNNLNGIVDYEPFLSSAYPGGKDMNCTTSSLTCTDTDGPGRVFDIAGTTTGPLTTTATTVTTKSDVCVTSNLFNLLEYHCLSGLLTFTAYNCTNGCKSGACIRPICVDSDGGKNYSVKGTVTFAGITSYKPDIPGGKNYTDKCGGVRSVNEFYCNGNVLSAVSALCPSGTNCSNGACKSAVTPICGNGIIDSGEQCDGTNLNSQTCITKGYSGGILSCNSSCGFNFNNCVSNPIPTNCTDSDGGLNYTIKGTVVDKTARSETDYCTSSSQLVEGYCRDEGYFNYVYYQCACMDGACV